MIIHLYFPVCLFNASSFIYFVYSIIRSTCQLLCSIQYGGFAESVRSLVVIFQSLRCHVTNFYPLTTVSHIHTAEDKVSHFNKLGVYFSCGQCSATYVGQTGRKLKKRIDEHRTSNSELTDNTAVALHCINNEHDKNKM